MRTPSIAAIGECMLELSRRPANAAIDPSATALAYGGDSLNTTLYLSRLGCAVNYVTALGDDSLSSWMIDSWEQEGIDCALVDRHPGGVPGLYFIETDAAGERSFLYWRDQAPAKRLFDDAVARERLFTKLINFNYLYLSGITLAVLSDVSRAALLDWLPTYRASGGKVIFDNNYRPRLWDSQQAAQLGYRQMYGLSDIALPTYEDEVLLFGTETEESVLERLTGYGVNTVVLKLGERGCRVKTATDDTRVSAYSVIPRDTTAAGDSFNAGFLAGFLNGKSLVASADQGCRLASVVVQHPGAIIDKSLLEDFTSKDSLA